MSIIKFKNLKLSLLIKHKNNPSGIAKIKLNKNNFNVTKSPSKIPVKILFLLLPLLAGTVSSVVLLFSKHNTSSPNHFSDISFAFPEFIILLRPSSISFFNVSLPFLQQLRHILL